MRPSLSPYQPKTETMFHHSHPLKYIHRNRLCPLQINNNNHYYLYNDAKKIVSSFHHLHHPLNVIISGRRLHCDKWLDEKNKNCHINGKWSSRFFANINSPFNKWKTFLLQFCCSASSAARNVDGESHKKILVLYRIGFVPLFIKISFAYSVRQEAKTAGSSSGFHFLGLRRL